MRPETKAILNKLENIESKVETLKSTVQDLINFCKDVDILEGIETEEQFIAVLAEVIDELVKLPAPYEWFDDKAAAIVLKLLDKHLLDKVLGEDWFKKLKQKIG
ncbi:MAG: hypothetical protein DRO18_03675 [Thermoprotei archaeon]|nr:MAG: hypothetical protein DRO18_03675 [Thermoprotei archaeon]